MCCGNQKGWIVALNISAMMLVACMVNKINNVAVAEC